MGFRVQGSGFISFACNRGPRGGGSREVIGSLEFGVPKDVDCLMEGLSDVLLLGDSLVAGGTSSNTVARSGDSPAKFGNAHEPPSTLLQTIRGQPI